MSESKMKPRLRAEELTGMKTEFVHDSLFDWKPV